MSKYVVQSIASRVRFVYPGGESSEEIQTGDIVELTDKQAKNLVNTGIVKKLKEVKENGKPSK